MDTVVINDWQLLRDNTIKVQIQGKNTFQSVTLNMCWALDMLNEIKRFFEIYKVINKAADSVIYRYIKITKH